MLDSLEIEADWISFGEPETAEDYAFARLRMLSQDASLIQLEDTVARSTRDHAYLNALDLARWLASNWWRLLYEPVPKTASSDYRASHELTAISGGGAWPSIAISSDGEIVTLDVDASPGSDRQRQAVVYFRADRRQVAVGDFEGAMDDFVTRVRSRLAAVERADETLEELWEALSAERADADLRWRRRLEAVAGFDAETAPAELLDEAASFGARYGRDAALEMLALWSGQWSDRAREVIARLTGANAPVMDLRALMDRVAAGVRKIDGEPGLPWQRAGRAARFVRAEFGLGDRPIPDDELVGLAGLGTTALLDQQETGAAAPLSDLSAGLAEEGDAGLYRVGIRKRKHKENRRFEVTRVFSDILVSAPSERFHAAHDGLTARQKFQRAFACEFLCPLEAMKARVSPGLPDEEEIRDVADEYGVSWWIVERALINDDYIAERSRR